MSTYFVSFMFTFYATSKALTVQIPPAQNWNLVPIICELTEDDTDTCMETMGN